MRKICLLFCCSIVIPIVFFGCATTGLGEFPRLASKYRGGKLIVAPVAGPVSTTAKKRLLSRLQIARLRQRFERVDFLAAKQFRQFGFDKVTYPLADFNLDTVSKTIDSDYLLALQIDQFREERFVARETETLSYSRNRSRETTFTKNREVPDTSPRQTGLSDTSTVPGLGVEAGVVTTREHIYSTEEIPVSETKIRVVISVSAYFYDLRNRQLIWLGNRVEEASGELEYVSAVELRETVLSRIARRLSSALAPGG